MAIVKLNDAGNRERNALYRWAKAVIDAEGSSLSRHAAPLARAQNESIYNTDTDAITWRGRTKTIESIMNSTPEQLFAGMAVLPFPEASEQARIARSWSATHTVLLEQEIRRLADREQFYTDREDHGAKLDEESLDARDFYRRARLALIKQRRSMES